MKTTNRRDFIQQTTFAAVAVSVAPSLHPADANNRLMVGLIGPGGMEMNHLRVIVTYKNARRGFRSRPPLRCSGTPRKHCHEAGRTLKFDPVKDEFINDDEANRLVRRTYRENHRAAPQNV